MGRRCQLADGEWRIVEILTDPDALVLSRPRPQGSARPIQSDSYGNPARRAPETRVVPYLDEEGNLSTEAEALLRCLQKD
ncbi:MAG: hypothetical protein ABFS23_03020 [Pseudomonadota bacterium]